MTGDQERIMAQAAEIDRLHIELEAVKRGYPTQEVEIERLRHEVQALKAFARLFALAWEYMADAEDMPTRSAQEQKAMDARDVLWSDMILAYEYLHQEGMIEDGNDAAERAKEHERPRVRWPDDDHRDDESVVVWDAPET